MNKKKKVKKQRGEDREFNLPAKVLVIETIL